jgi:hypothetical protein
MTCGGRALVFATLQEANWSRSSSCWDMSRFKQPSDTLAASSGFGRRSMIASESNQVAESPGGSGRVADVHVVICQVKARVSRARSGERANQQFQDVLRATVCLSASVPALGRTRHPFAVSGLEWPSQKIEFVFSASPETIRREPRECDLLRSVGNMQDLAVCAFLFILFISAVFYAAVVLRSSAGTKSLCC